MAETQQYKYQYQQAQGAQRSRVFLLIYLVLIAVSITIGVAVRLQQIQRVSTKPTQAVNNPPCLFCASEAVDPAYDNEGAPTVVYCRDTQNNVIPIQGAIVNYNFGNGNYNLTTNPQGFTSGSFDGWHFGMSITLTRKVTSVPTTFQSNGTTYTVTNPTAPKSNIDLNFIHWRAIGTGENGPGDTFVQPPALVFNSASGYNTQNGQLQGCTAVAPVGKRCYQFSAPTGVGDTVTSGWNPAVNYFAVRVGSGGGPPALPASPTASQLVAYKGPVAKFEYRCSFPGASVTPTPTPTPTATPTPTTTGTPTPTVSDTPTPTETPTPTVGLTVTASKTGPVCVERVAPDNIATFTITITNSNDSFVNIPKISDTLPQGFTYVDGSTTLDGSSSADPDIDEVGSSQLLNWTNNDLGYTVQAGTNLVLRYQAEASTTATTGENNNRVVIEVEGNNAIDNITHEFQVAQTCGTPSTGIFDNAALLFVLAALFLITGGVFFIFQSPARMSVAAIQTMDQRLANADQTITHQKYHKGRDQLEYRLHLYLKKTKSDKKRPGKK